jgi:hypothetical protein
MLHDLKSFTQTLHPLGYITVYYPTHPNAWKNSKSVYFHRLVMENKLNRYLEDFEHVHHIDENRLNNDPENLEILTSSEHCKLHHPVYLELKICRYCKKEFQPDSIEKQYCSVECYRIDQEKDIASKEDLEKIIWKIPSEEIGKFYNVSGRMIGKWCKKYGIEKPPRGYWAKQKNRYL